MYNILIFLTPNNNICLFKIDAHMSRLVNLVIYLPVHPLRIFDQAHVCVCTLSLILESILFRMHGDILPGES